MITPDERQHGDLNGHIIAMFASDKSMNHHRKWSSQRQDHTHSQNQSSGRQGFNRTHHRNQPSDGKVSTALITKINPPDGKVPSASVIEILFPDGSIPFIIETISPENVMTVANSATLENLNQESQNCQIVAIIVSDTRKHGIWETNTVAMITSDERQHGDLNGHIIAMFASDPGNHPPNPVSRAQREQADVRRWA